MADMRSSNPASRLSIWLAVAVNKLKALIRRTEIGLVLVGAVAGVIAGLAVTTMSETAQLLHRIVFGISGAQRLSGVPTISAAVTIAAPVVGGVILGSIIYLLAVRHKKPIVDPIEANALHGGRLSFADSIVVAVQNVISNGFGGSVGLEAGYTQLAAGIASTIGTYLKLRRADLRILVGCGAAGAIAAAFNAPLTGAFYAFELIIGNYAIVSLTPVVVSALVATTVARTLGGSEFIIDVGYFGLVTTDDYLPAMLLGLFCAGAGILLMQGVAFVEQVAQKSATPPWLRPLIGGAIVGTMAILTPQVLSAGHGALYVNLANTVPIQVLLAVMLLKSVASAISIGSGFRGGLFFASLFLGALFGKLFAYSGPFLFASTTLTPVIYAVVGMSSLAVSIIGGPMTMTFLALEITGNFSITVLVLAAVVTASLTVRTTFGYSFATWRFHLRGESIRSAHDVGWIRNLTVDRLMRADVRTAALGMTVEAFRREFPLGSTQRVVVVDSSEKYAGIVIVAEGHSLSQQDETADLTGLIRYRNDFLLPQMNAKQAAAIFDRTESEALAVVDNLIERRVVGLLTESYTLRRYSEELDRRRREISGEV
jgi:CIC family chloride channel protein